MRPTIRILVLGLALIGCDDGLTLPGTPVALTNLAAADADYVLRDNRAFAVRERIVVSSQAQWEQVWARFEDMDRPAPAIDFTKNTVIVAAMGTRNHGGFAITVEGASRMGTVVHAGILERSPGSNCVTTAAIVYPVTVVVVATTATSIEFIERTKTHRC